MNAKGFVLASLAFGIMLVHVGAASAQSRGFSNRDRLFMVYNAMNSQRNQRQIYQQQQQMQGQFNQFSRQQMMLSGRMLNLQDPIDQYVQQAEGKQTGRPYVPPIYSGMYRSHFGGHMRYFNPPR